MKNKIILYLLTLLLLAACATVPKDQFSTFEIQNKIIEKLAYLKECRAEGLATINYNNFEIKTNFLLRKKDSKVRIDVFSSGILGLSPSPKAQIVLKDNFVNMFIPDQKQLTITRLIPADSLVNVQDVVATHSVVESFGYYIASPFNGVYYIFDKKLHLESAQVRDIRIQFSEYKKDLPHKITILQKKVEIISLEVDKWNFQLINNNVFDFEVPANVQIDANELDLRVPIEIIEEDE